MPPTPAEISQAAAELGRGRIVAFPTETFYGLAVNPFVAGSLASLFALKQRSPDKPLLVLIDKLERLDELVALVPPLYRPLLAKFWPGPLTLIFPARPGLPSGLCDAQGTIGIRLSSQPLACALAAAAGGVITGTSANPSGVPAAHSAGEVCTLFPAETVTIVDGGRAPGGLGSTIVAADGGGLRLVRPGVIPFSEVLAAVAATECPGCGSSLV